MTVPVKGCQRNVAAVFFDLDDTLLDHHGAVTRSALRFRRRHAVLQQDGPSRFLQRWHDLVHQAFTAFLGGRLSLDEARIWRMQTLFAAAGRRLARTEALDFAMESVSLYEQCWRLFDDVPACLASLKELPLGVISNGGCDQQRRKLQRLALDGCFSTVIISESCGVQKPSPDIFRAACRDAGVPVHRCVHIGDDWKMDAQAARRAGLTGIWLNRARTGHAAGRRQSAARPTDTDMPTITSLSQLDPKRPRPD